jgi:hypothetical protein
LTRRFLTRVDGSPILVDHSVEDSVMSDRGIKVDHGRGIVAGWALVEALVRAVVVDVALVVVEDGADESLGIAIRLGGRGGGLTAWEAFGGEHGVEGVGELGVPVADQEAERADLLTQIHQQVTGDLGSAGRGRMGGDTEQVHCAGAYFHHEQDVESARRDGVQGEEVGGQQPRGLSAWEISPVGVCSVWCWAEAAAALGGQYQYSNGKFRSPPRRQSQPLVGGSDRD